MQAFGVAVDRCAHIRWTRTNMTATAKNKWVVFGCVIVATVAAGVIYVYWNKAVPLAGIAINYFRSFSAPAGSTFTELAPGISGAVTLTASNSAATAAPDAIAGG